MKTLFPYLLCFALFVGCSTAPKNSSEISVDSDKTPLRISFHPPIGWTGPGKGVWPSYESWGFSRGEEPDDRYISVRVDMPRPDVTPKDYDSLSDSEVADSLKDIFENPIVKTISYVPVNRKPVRFRKAINVSGSQIYGHTSVDGIPISLELFSNSGMLHAEDVKAFFAFVKSLEVTVKKK